MIWLALLSLLAWFYLLLAKGGFWRGRERLDAAPGEVKTWPAVVAVVPARNEADVIEKSLGSILAQDYAGELCVILVDDNSSDGTGEAAQRLNDPRLTILSGQALPPGWVGKLWALQQGIAKAGAAPYLWLTDADIGHAPDTLRRLIAKAEGEKRTLVSLMVKLWCQSFWEKLLIPPFVYFFQMLYPFATANNDKRKIAAAAGGCILLKRERLAEAGGLAAMKAALIDDCTLAKLIKPVARKHGEGIFVALTDRSHSLRPYRGLGEIWRMVARSAYWQLRHSPLLLFGTLLGMTLLYVIPVVSAFVWSDWRIGALGLSTWALMSFSFLPTLKLYRLSPLWAPSLALAGLIYSAMTFDSARRHYQGKGGAWKGRVGAGNLSP